MFPASPEDIVAPPGDSVQQFSVLLENRVGALSQVVDLLSEGHVEVLGLSVQDSVDFTVVRMVVSDPATVEALFASNDVRFTTTPVLVVELVHGAADMGRCLHALLIAELNIHFSYPLLVRPNGRPVLALLADDVDFGQEVLTKEGFKVLYQDDLSR